MRVAKRMALDAEIRRKLERQARDRSTPIYVALRGRIALPATDGIQDEQISGGSYGHA